MKRLAQKIFLVIFSFAISSAAECQSIDSIKIFIKDIQRGGNDSIRLSANEKFIQGFEKILHQDNSFTMKFDSLKNVSVLEDESKTFRIYTWVVPHYDGSKYDYFGYVQLRDSNVIVPLHDSTAIIQKPESEKLSSSRWYGAIYYSIITVEQAGKKYYTLLGWKGKNQNQTEKVVDVLYFVKGQAKFGYPLLKSGSVFHNRIIFTYSSNLTMTLHYDTKFGGIVFDHLAGDKNQNGLSGPDGTYDAFKLRKGRWTLYRDIDVRTKWSPSETLPEPPADIK